MTSHIDRMRTRNVRAVLQIGAAVGVVAAVGLAFVDDDLARAGTTALLGGVLLVVLKASMVAAQAAATARPVAAPPPGASPTELSELRAGHEALLAELRESQAEIVELRDRLETVTSLARRVEPSVAESATLRHEMTYLRETVERLDRTNGSG